MGDPNWIPSDPPNWIPFGVCRIFWGIQTGFHLCWDGQLASLQPTCAPFAGPTKRRARGGDAAAWGPGRWCRLELTPIFFLSVCILGPFFFSSSSSSFSWRSCWESIRAPGTLSAPFRGEKHLKPRWAAPRAPQAPQARLHGPRFPGVFSWGGRLSGRAELQTGGTALDGSGHRKFAVFRLGVSGHCFAWRLMGVPRHVLGFELLNCWKSLSCPAKMLCSC